MGSFLNRLLRLGRLGTGHRRQIATIRSSLYCAAGTGRPAGLGRGFMPKLAFRVPAWAPALLLGLAALLLGTAAEAAQDNQVSCAGGGQLLPQKLRSGGGNASGQQP